MFFEMFEYLKRICAGDAPPMEGIRMRLLKFVVFAATAAPLVWSERAVANTVVFTDEAAFMAATTSQTVIGFNGILPPGAAAQGFNPLTVSGVSFSTPTPDTLVNVTSATYYTPNDYPADFIVDSANPSLNNELDITLPLATRAMAFK